MQTTVTAVAGDKATFYWKVSSQSGDCLRFYIDDDLQDSISGEVDWQKKSYALSAGSRTLKWVYDRDSSGEAGLDRGWVDGLTVGTESLTAPAGDYAEALDCDLKFTSTGYSESTWSIASGVNEEYYYDGDAAQSNDSLESGQESCLQTIVDIDSAETVKFYWKVSCQSGYDYLEFYIDDTRQDRITGNVDWQQKSYSVSSGIHILKWRYISGGGQSGEKCGWVDFVQWTGPSPDQNPQQWGEITYKHDINGKRAEKKVDGYSTRYVYDGEHVVAEYDGNNNLLRKYIYGPGVDKPVSMTEVADNNATYYYHFDGLCSVVALSDSNGDTVQTYEYSVFGEVAVEDVNHTNPYMFAGRRYDIEIGLYYNRARYYNPYTGRFLQTDPIGYADGMNVYAYCGSNPVNGVDPSGLSYNQRFLSPGEFGTPSDLLFFVEIFEHAGGHIDYLVLWSGEDLEDWYQWAMDENVRFDSAWMAEQPGFELWINNWENAQLDERLFWEIHALIYLGIYSPGDISYLGIKGVKIALTEGKNRYKSSENTIYWNRSGEPDQPWGSVDWAKNIPALAILTHELAHANLEHRWKDQGRNTGSEFFATFSEFMARAWENRARNVFYHNVPGYGDVYPRPWMQAGSFGVDAWTAWNYWSNLPGKYSLWNP